MSRGGKAKAVWLYNSEMASSDQAMERQWGERQASLKPASEYPLIQLLQLTVATVE